MTIKFNSGNPVIICDNCRKIIRPIKPDDTNVERHLCKFCYAEIIKENL